MIAKDMDIYNLRTDEQYVSKTNNPWRLLKLKVDEYREPRQTVMTDYFVLLKRGSH